MNTRSPSGRAIGTLLVAVLVASLSTASSIGAQQTAPRPGQSPGPRFLVGTLVSDGSKLGFQVANAVRDRIASDFEMRTLWVVPESVITKGLQDSGYPVDQPLSKSETKQLTQAFRADETLLGTVFRTPSGGYRVEADWSLTRRDDMVQPLPPVEAAKIGDVAKLLAREFSAARQQVESVQRCNDLARARNVAGALAAARKAIDTYPRSVLGRICIANIYAQEKLGPDSMIRVSQEILAIHPRNVRALGFAADAYEAKGATDDLVRTLRVLTRVDSTNRDVPLRLVRVLAAAGRFEEAVPEIDSLVAREPANVDAVALQWRVHLNAKDWAGALRIGETYIALDSTAATREFFIRMIAAADAAGDAAKASELAKRGVAKFPADDELAMLDVQFLRRVGSDREALNALSVIVGRNPRVLNAFVQKARLEAALGYPVDTVLASFRRAQETGEAPPSVSRQAIIVGQNAAKDSTAADKREPIRTAIRYYKFAESVHATDTTALIVGSASLSLGQLAANEARTARQCDPAKEAQAALVDAQISLPKAGARFPAQVTQLMAILAQSLAYADQVAKAVCR
jgi:tetratricopeptide (TPR) repeat protein